MVNFFDGLPERYTMLVRGPKTIDKTILCIDMIRHYIEKGEKALYMSTDADPDKVRRMFFSRGFDIAKNTDRFAVIDCFTPWTSQGWSEGNMYSMSPEPDIDTLKLSIIKATHRLGERVHVFVNSASTVMLHNGAAATIQLLRYLCDLRYKKYLSVTMVTHDGEQDKMIDEQIAALVSITLELSIGDREQTYIKQSRSGETSNKLLLYHINEMDITFEGA